MSAEAPSTEGREVAGRDPFARAFIYGLGIAVGVAWFVSVIADIALKDAYKTPFEMHGLMGVVVGAVFGAEQMRRGRERIEKLGEEAK